MCVCLSEICIFDSYMMFNNNLKLDQVTKVELHNFNKILEKNLQGIIVSGQVLSNKNCKGDKNKQASHIL